MIFGPQPVAPITVKFAQLGQKYRTRSGKDDVNVNRLQKEALLGVGTHPRPFIHFETIYAPFDADGIAERFAPALPIVIVERHPPPPRRARRLSARILDTNAHYDLRVL